MDVMSVTPPATRTGRSSGPAAHPRRLGACAPEGTGPGRRGDSLPLVLFLGWDEGSNGRN